MKTNFLSNKKIWVAGHNGMVGSAICKKLRENKIKADSFMDRQIRMMDLLNETRVRARKEFKYLRKLKERRINFSFDPIGSAKAEEKLWNDYKRDWEDFLR